MMLIIISTNGPCRDKKLLGIKLKLVGSKVLTRDLDLVTRLNAACWFLTDGLNAALILPTASFPLYELMICAYLLFFLHFTLSEAPVQRILMRRAHSLTVLEVLLNCFGSVVAASCMCMLCPVINLES